MGKQHAIIMLSGGLDSVTALAWAMREGYIIQEAISFIYGQQHIKEIGAAEAVAKYYGITHRVVSLATILGSRLTNLGNIPQGRNLDNLEEVIAPTYVPNRNMILIGYAAAQALLTDVEYLIGGWNAADGANYPDCRNEFLAAVEQTLRLATLREFVIVRPLIADFKGDIVRKALKLRAPVHLTWTCYLGGDVACGTCDACQLRISGFEAVGARDPLPYAIQVQWRS